MSKKTRVTNTFNDGLNFDTPNYQTPNSVYTYLQNGTFITHEGDELILQSERGTEKVAELKPNYILLAAKSYNNISYLVSAEAEYNEERVQTSVYNETKGYHELFFSLAGSYTIRITNPTQANDENSYNIEYELKERPGSRLEIRSDNTGTVYPQGSLNVPTESIEILVNATRDESLQIITNGVNTKVELLKNETKKSFVRLTGRGEVGTYPSPDYSNLQDFNCSSEGCDKSTTIIDKYEPLFNYAGDDNNPVLTRGYQVKKGYGEFNSRFFNFQSDKPIEIVAVQPVYDGTVNIIFTDNFNRPKIVNSRFSVRTDNRVEIIERTGKQDSNLYSQKNFSNTLNHIFTTNKIVSFSYNGQVSRGGNLAAGGYKYYFKYLTQNGEESGIIAESNVIPVVFGNTINTIRGGLPNEATIKANKLRLENLDISYDKIKVYFGYTTGEGGVAVTPTIFEIQREYDFSSTVLDITHTGFESTITSTNDVLNVTPQQIKTYKTGCEVKGRLMIGNVTNKTFNTNVLRDFARNITVHSKKRSFEYRSLKNTDSDFNRADFSELDTLIDFTSNEEGFYNPKNNHDYRIYRSGESYCFSAEFVFDDGFTSPLFPIRGIDNLLGTASYNASFQDAGLDSDNLFNITTGENIKGIYRFPRNTDLYNPNGGVVNGYYPEFHIPQITEQLTDLGVIGIKLYRAERNKNAIDQGIIMHTFVIPDLTADDRATEYEKLFNVTENLDTLSRASFFPILPNYHTECNSRNAAEQGFDNQGKFNQGYASGTIPKNYAADGVILTTSNYDEDADLSYWKNKAFSLITSNIANNPLEQQKLYSASNYVLEKAGEFDWLYTGRTFNPYIDKNSQTGQGTYFSVLQANNFQYDSALTQNVKLDYVQGTSTGKTINSFEPRVKFRALVTSAGAVDDYLELGDDKNPNNVLTYPRFDLKFNDYLGVYIEEPGQFPVFNEPPEKEVAGSLVGSSLYNNEAGFKMELVNVYRDGIFSTETLRDLYTPEFELFTPITQGYYFNNDIAEEFEASSDNILENINYQLPAYNGDCYIMPVYRRIFSNSLEKGESDTDETTIFRSEVNSGYTVMFPSECDFNPIYRQNTIGLTENEDVRTFYPFNAKSVRSVKHDSRDNDFRNNRSLETDEYNSGQGFLRSSIAKRPLDFSRPFVQNNFNTRISFSPVYNSNSFENVYRIFNPLAFKDYSRNLGEITALRSIKGKLVCVQENGITIIPVNERIAQTGDSAGEVFFNDLQVLPDPKHVGYLTEEYGSKWQTSVVVSDNSVYGVDIDKAKIWRIENGINFISDYKIQSFLRNIKADYENKDYSWFRTQIRSYFDRFKNCIIFSFIKSDDDCEQVTITTEPVCPESEFIKDSLSGTIRITGGSTGEERTLDTACFTDKINTIVFNEIPSNKWKTTNNYYPYNMFSIRDKLHGLNLLDNNESIYEFYKSDKFSYYFDKQEDFIVEVNVTGGTSSHWIYENLQIISNEYYPYKIEYTTDQGTVVQSVRPRHAVELGADGYKKEPIDNLTTYNAVYKEGQMYLTIVKDESDLYATINPNNQEVRDKYCKIKLYYNTSNKVIIQAILTTITQSLS